MSDGKKEKARSAYLSLCEAQDAFGFFDRSAASKKGWQTRKQNGGWGGKFMSESGKNIPSWKGTSVQPSDAKPKAGEPPKQSSPKPIPSIENHRKMSEWMKGRKGDEWVG